jgi:tetratricopeptide (TPR) repeat protein
MGLAQVFTAQGQTAKAIEAYRYVFYDLSLRGFDGPEKEEYRQKIYQNPVGATQYVSDGLRYALLLNQTGQWSEAVIVYNSALQGVPGGALPKLDLPFDASSPQPVAFEAMTRMALGLVLNFGVRDDKNQDAMKQYAIALQLEPSWALTNYYYGYGWQLLSPAERAKFGMAQQAKAALQKAVKVGDAEVKKAAEKALKDAG